MTKTRTATAETVAGPVTDHDAAERRQGVTSALLELFARKSSRKEYLHSVVEVLHTWSGCECVGIRILDAEGNLPYESELGFGEDFVQLENYLSLRRDACFCIRAATRESIESDGAARTAAGSFRCDDLTGFAAGLSADALVNYRTACIKTGFASLAVVPIIYRDQILGVIHLADRRKGMATEAMVAFLEAMTPLVGEAVHRFNAEAELVEYRDHLEELVLDRTNDLRRVAQELARSNMDLEQYAYVVSHDLQEPLRAVDGFVALLRRKYQGQLDAEANSFIDSAVEGVQRMQSLIRDLLAYARATPRDKPPTSTDVRHAVDDALDNLRTSIAEAEAVVTFDRLPRVHADRGQLAQLFQNLIGNAIKFRGDRRPEIRIDAQRQQDAWLFSVRDNGIGIDPQHAERVFLIFQRLHKRSQYPGTGIGLAICKKIVEHYGGKIWVESQSGHGATFHFTLPAKDDESVRTPRNDEEKCSKT